MVDDPRGALVAKKREIATLIEDLTAALDSAGSAANRSRSDRYGLSSERYSQAGTLLELRTQASIVDRALAKLEDGTYGVCDSCGAQIPSERCEIHPWAVLCVPCADS